MEQTGRLRVFVWWMCVLVVGGQGWSPTQRIPEEGVRIGGENTPQTRREGTVTDQVVRESDAVAWDALATKQQQDRYFFDLGVDGNRPGTATSLHANFIASKKESIDLSESGLVFTKATENVAKRISLSPVRSRSLPIISQNFPKPQFRCPYQSPRCDPNARYRTADGSCNNLRNPLWGKAVTPLQRFLAPRYQDGKNKSKPQ